MTKQRPPIWVFPAAVLLAALVCVVSLVVGNLAAPHVLYLERLNSATGTRHVVVIGTSKTRRGIDYDDRFTERPGLPNGLVFHRITRDNAAPRLLEPALTALLVNPPDLLLIESDLLLVDRHSWFDHPWWSTTFMELQSYLLNLSRNLSLLLEGGPGYDGNDGVDRGIAPGGLRAYAAALRSLGRHLADCATRGDHPVNDAIKTVATPRQPPLCCWHVPASATAARLQPASLEHELTLQRQQLQADLQAPFWSPGALPESNYCDLAHLNDDGRKRYSDWLAEQIIAWQESRH